MPHLVPEVCKAVVLKCIGQLSIIQAGFSMCTFYLFWLCSLSIPTSQVCKHLQSRTVCNNRYGSTQRNCPKQSSVLFNRVRISFLVSLLAGPWQGARLLEDGQVGRKAAEERKSFGGAGGSLDSNMKCYLWRAYLLHPTLPSSPAKSVTLESTSAGPNGPSKQG